MNIFKSLFGKNTRPAEVKQDPIQEKAYCPYCKAELKSFPTQKKKCPHCGNMIYVKSRYGSSIKVLATEAEKDEIDADKQLHYFENRNLRNLVDIPVILTPHSGHIDPPGGFDLKNVND